MDNLILAECDQPLKCAKCSGDSIHYEDVTIYSRPKDYEDVSVTTFGKDFRSYSDFQRYPKENPSARSKGIVLNFICEHCSNEWQMCISDHKGQTLISWRDRA